MHNTSSPLSLLDSHSGQSVPHNGNCFWIWKLDCGKTGEEIARKPNAVDLIILSQANITSGKIADLNVVLTHGTATERGGNKSKS